MNVAFDLDSHVFESSPLKTPLSPFPQKGMGVHGLFPFLKKKKVPYTHYHSFEDFTSTMANQEFQTYVDFSACFFNYITTQLAISTLPWKIDQIIEFIVSIIKEIPRVVVVFDGPGRSIEKWNTSKARVQKTKSDLEMLKNAITQCSSSNPINISRSKWRWLNKKLKSCRMLPANVIESIKDVLSARSITIETAPMEADVLIASKENAHVLTTDSDYLIHENVVALHRFRLSNFSKKITILSTERNSILKKLGIPSQTLTALGIVSRNDYDTNVAGFGLVRNFEKLKPLNGNVQRILSSYCKDMSINSNPFQNSISIFVEKIVS